MKMDATWNCPTCRQDAVAKQLLPVSVATDAQIWSVAELRNACRDGFSHDRETIISREQQFAWWAEQGERLRGWLFHDQTFCGRCHGTGVLFASNGSGARWVSPSAGTPAMACPRCHGTARRPIGFGVLRPYEHGGLAATCGVDPSARGHNYGRAIMRYLAHTASLLGLGRLRSTALMSNAAAVKLHDAEHWVRTRERERTEEAGARLATYEARVRFLAMAEG